MSEGNRNAALAGAILTVAVAVGLSVWYAGTLEAEDETYGASNPGQEGSAAKNYEMLEEQMSATDQKGDIVIDETEVDLDLPEEGGRYSKVPSDSSASKMPTNSTMTPPSRK